MPFFRHYDVVSQYDVILRILKCHNCISGYISYGIGDQICIKSDTNRVNISSIQYGSKILADLLFSVFGEIHWQNKVLLKNEWSVRLITLITWYINLVCMTYVLPSQLIGNRFLFGWLRNFDVFANISVCCFLTYCVLSVYGSIFAQGKVISPGVSSYAKL